MRSCAQIRRQGLRIEQHRLVEVEGKGVVLTNAHVGVGAHARGQLLAGDMRHDEGVGTAGSTISTVASNFRHRVSVAVNTSGSLTASGRMPKITGRAVGQLALRPR